MINRYENKVLQAINDGNLNVKYYLFKLEKCKRYDFFYKLLIYSINCFHKDPTIERSYIIGFIMETECVNIRTFNVYMDNLYKLFLIDKVQKSKILKSFSILNKDVY